MIQRMLIDTNTRTIWAVYNGKKIQVGADELCPELMLSGCDAAFHEQARRQLAELAKEQL